MVQKLKFCTVPGFINFLAHRNILLFDGAFRHRNSLLKFAYTTVYGKIGLHAKYLLHGSPGHVGKTMYNSNLLCTESALYPKKTKDLELNL